MQQTLAKLCELVNGELIGDGNTVIEGVNVFDAVKAGELTFAENQRHFAKALDSEAVAIIISKKIPTLEGRPGIRVEQPRLAFAVLLELFYPEEAKRPGVHSSVVLGKKVHIAPDVSIQVNAVIGDEVSIGRGTIIGAGVYIGDGTALGEQCVLDPNVVIYRRTQIGDRVKIHAGSVIGGDGFGYVFDQEKYVKIPQIGNVVIEDDVELGCNVCIDRATMGSTVIRQGVKMDNLVQIAHNDRIGKHVLMAGQVGLSGSVSIGDYTVMGGKAGIVDHVRVGSRAKIGAASVVTKDIPDNETFWGYPARPLNQMKKKMAASSRLPSLMNTIKKLIDRVRRNESRLARLEEREP